ncbi:signal recognition particle binding protein [Hysterangium stoloniferum]|nr:signal recognition particle binding protein [Hysterangium stoloniferum]
MLDHCGIVLWSRSFTPAAEQLAASAASPVNSLIRDVLIEGRTSETNYEKDGYAIKWSFVNDLELIFVATYQRILQLTYPEDLLNAMKTLFLKLFQPFLTSFVASLHAAQSAVTAIDTTVFNLRTAFEGWDKVFDKLLAGFEERDGKDRHARLRSAPRPAAGSLLERESSSESLDNLPRRTAESTSTSAEEIAMNVEAFKARMKGRGGMVRGRGRGGKKLGRGGGSAPGSESGSNITTKHKLEKVARKWDDSSITEKDMAELDFSVDGPALDDVSTVDIQNLVDQASLGTKKNGIYEVKDWDFAAGKNNADEDDLISRALNQSLTNGKTETKATSTLGSIFARLTGSKVLADQDLTPVLSAMKDHLMKKNVAKDIAEQICEGVGETLKGKKIGGFRGIKSEVQTALSTTLTRILTPKSSTDLLLSIRSKLSSAAASTSSAGRVPYSMTFVGVNGVGKSTNLSKVCFWLIQNGFRVLIAACDTFRSGAVEQLRVHVRNLGMLSAKEGESAMVELYERGYGKDAAGIARDAISYARDAGFDVVLIDTAGRMQDNEPLMRALAKLVSTNNPDKIIFVGEALVGNEAVDQLSKFDRSLRDFSTGAGGPGKGRGIDGMLVTKWDTVDDKVGAALSMTYVTGQPILFVGCGQTYTDLRQLKVSNVVDALLSD